MEERNWSDLLW